MGVETVLRWECHLLSPWELLQRLPNRFKCGHNFTQSLYNVTESHFVRFIYSKRWVKKLYLSKIWNRFGNEAIVFERKQKRSFVFLWDERLLLGTRLSSLNCAGFGQLRCLGKTDLCLYENVSILWFSSANKIKSTLMKQNCEHIVLCLRVLDVCKEKHQFSNNLTTANTANARRINWLDRKRFGKVLEKLVGLQDPKYSLTLEIKLRSSNKTFVHMEGAFTSLFLQAFFPTWLKLYYEMLQ